MFTDAVQNSNPKQEILNNSSLLFQRLLFSVSHIIKCGMIDQNVC